MQFRVLCASLIGAGMLAFSSSAFAWGPYGHAIVADIAQERLTPQASKAAAALLELENHQTLDQVASWPDTIGHVPKKKGGAPETLKWHYVDIDVSHPAYDQARDCSDHACVVEKLPEEIRILADTHASPQDRLVALKWVVHLMGDIHQPLHAAERNKDMGGNAIHLTYFGNNANGHMNLHSLWDEGVIDHEADLHVGPFYSIDPARAKQEADRLGALITPDEAQYWVQDLAAGNVHDATVNWADESHSLARSVAYGALPANKGADVGKAYTELTWPIMQLRLEQAGVRLAAVLNSALSNG
ncbi:MULTISPECIES: S1/P1 nuclease [Gluconobacter]|uniref:Nuclease n=1 Tax=Gluconobacter cadivus TaxID=2728101 RepID=A0ABR9YT51_9PROT|nr:MULTISPECIES: S1/P1 nuclease [Gluconobacter]MBF0887361.1 nuclease [Gluconobacter cadivus]MBS1058431.1 S1/P1 nuclease [Gluconobacter sp. Dm-44]